LPSLERSATLPPVSYEQILRRADELRQRVAEVVARAGRTASDVEILPITKGHSASCLTSVRAAGFTMIGENRVHEAAAKLEAVDRLGLRWHMVGHLQRNKAAKALEVFDVIESVDSVRLAARLSEEVVKREMSPVTVLAQVNASGESSKSGFDADALVDAVGHMLEFEGLTVDGLMTMAPFTSDEAVLRCTFGRVRELLASCRTAFSGAVGRTLSMGMSNDFEIAIQEGSTRVRLGTVLLGERPVR
jgi:pyridoxal phosphate enzyme (YggS family)